MKLNKYTFLRIKKTLKRVHGLFSLKNIGKSPFLPRKAYVSYWLKESLDEKRILLESQHGRHPGGNILAIAKELNTEDYTDYEIYLSCAAVELKERQAFLNQQKLHRIKLVPYGSKKYYKVLATAKFLINDNTFVHVFFKKPGQVYLNTWHGTPLKTLGKAMLSDYHAIGNAQRNMISADYLLCPNEFTKEVFTRDYMIENIGTGKLWLTGYPRNTIFFDEEKSREDRKTFGLEGKVSYAYLPTWRGVASNVSAEAQNAELIGYFKELDGKLKDNQVIYVKLHPISSAGIDLSGFKHILPFPKGVDSYEFLNAVDGLITDYSSIFFDFAIRRKKIILFAYDEEEYQKKRGMYFPLSELPFPVTRTVAELVTEINSEKNYDDSAFLERFCKYDNPQITKAIVAKFLKGVDTELIKEENVPSNGKENVFIFGSNLDKNGITSSMMGLLSHVDTAARNYIVFFRTNEVYKNASLLKTLPQGVNYMGFVHARSTTFWEMVKYSLWKWSGTLKYKSIDSLLYKMAERENIRVFGGCRVDAAVQFNGYGPEIIAMLAKLPAKSIIYVHSDMEKEAATRENSDIELLSRAYKRYDRIAVVTEGLTEITERIAQKTAPLPGEKLAEISVCKNVIDYERVKNLCDKDVHYDLETVSEVSESKLKEILDSKAVKFVSVGRFSPEKGHDRLIKAFAEFNKTTPDSYLIIIGGLGIMYESTLKLAKESGCSNRIILIQYMSNPYAVLKRCSCFVLSSYYEGFGLVLAEGDISGIPVFSVDIPGPRLFMQRYNGVMVDNSQAGLVAGMNMFMEGKIPAQLTCDYEEYNREAVEAFEKIVKTA